MWDCQDGFAGASVRDGCLVVYGLLVFAVCPYLSSSANITKYWVWVGCIMSRSRLGQWVPCTPFTFIREGGGEMDRGRDSRDATSTVGVQSNYFQKPPLSFCARVNRFPSLVP